MLDSGRQFAQVCAQVLPAREPVYEFGSYLVPDMAIDADLRPLFGGQRFVGADIRPGPGVDQVLDLQDLALPDGSIGTAIAIDTLEHVERPWQAFSELHRVLAADGILILTVPFNFVIHAHPDDYWRFTPQAVHSLLRPFAQTWVRQYGLTDDPVSVLAVASKGVLAPSVWEDLDAAMEPLITLWDAVTRNWPG